MSDIRENPLFPAVLTGRLSLLLSAVIPSSVLFAVNALAFWVVWGEMKQPYQHIQACTLLLTSLLPALAGLPLLGLRKPLHGLLQVLLGVLCLAHLIAFCWMIGKVIPSDTPEWMLGPSFFLLQFAAMVPGLFLALWRLASVRTSLSPIKDFALSLVVSVIGPGVLYAFLTVSMLGLRVATDSGRWMDWLWKIVFPVIMIVCPVFFFLGLLRCLMWLRQFIARKSEEYRAVHLVYVGLVALVFPIGGLLLNMAIPFPADFQNPWPYVLTVLNAAALMMPETKQAWLNATARFLRWALMPFAFYFFIVFLPFMPFSLFAILAMGAGFLILAPTLLFVVQLQELKKDFDAWTQAGVSPKGRWLRILGALAILPLCFVARSEYDRAVLHQTLDFYYAREDTKDARSPVRAGDVKRILKRVRAFKDGAEIPYLTNWYNWRVFDNLLLQDEKFNDLWHAFVDDYPPEKGRDEFSRNMFGELFGGRTRSPGTRWGRMPRKVELTDVVTSSSTSNGEEHVRIRLSVTSRDQQQAEYEAKLHLPASAWVAGLRLKIGTNWVDGRIVERKAAEWVYRSIRDVRRDPAFLRYEGENLLTLSVFPVDVGQTREVELLVVFPKGFADALMIGDRRVPLSGEGIVGQCAYANGLLVASSRANAVQPPLWKEEGAFVIVDCSKGQSWSGEALAKALRRVRDEMRLSIRGVLFANYETKLMAVTEQDPGLLSAQCMKERLPERGGLDLDAAVRRAACATALSFTRQPATWSVPQMVLVRNKVKPPPVAGFGRARALALKGKEEKPLLAPKMKAQTFRAAQRWVPMLASRLTVVVSDQPVAEERLGAGLSLEDALQMVPVCLGEQVRWLSLNSRQACIFWEDGKPEAGLPLIWNPEQNAFADAPSCLRMPAEGVWAKGAEAWRLQTRFQQDPHLDDLRRDILKQSWSCGVITDVGSYIVVENSAQWKMLELKQKQTLAANSALDTVEVPAPSMVWLLLGVAVFMAGRRIWSRCAIRVG